MNQSLLIVLCALCSYLIGAANPAIILSTSVYKKDIRQEGSGNPGFTNFHRVFGGKLSWLVLLLDVGKTILLCAVFGNIFESFQLGAAIAGAFAVLGHCFPLWYQFKGGKGFLAFATTVFFIDWRAGLIGLAALVLVLLITKYMSLASILTVVSAVVSIAILGYSSIWVLICSILSGLLVILRHSANIKRLLSGNEKKFKFKH